MEVMVPWEALIDWIASHYLKTRKKERRPPYSLATMLRIHRLQQWYSARAPANAAPWPNHSRGNERSARDSQGAHPLQG